MLTTAPLPTADLGSHNIRQTLVARPPSWRYLPGYTCLADILKWQQDKHCFCEGSSIALKKPHHQLLNRRPAALSPKTPAVVLCPYLECTVSGMWTLRNASGDKTGMHLSSLISPTANPEQQIWAKVIIQQLWNAFLHTNSWTARTPSHSCTPSWPHCWVALLNHPQEPPGVTLTFASHVLEELTQTCTMSSTKTTTGKAGTVAEQVKSPPTVLASHVGAGSSPSYSTADPTPPTNTPGKSEWWSRCLRPRNQMKFLVPGSGQAQLQPVQLLGLNR